MSTSIPRPDVPKVLSRLKDFQRASAELVFRRLYLDPSPARRFLIADEVGLGKTLVARGVIAQAIEHLWDQIDRLDVLYICSNTEIARQNVRKLNPIEGVDVALASRITLLPITLKGLRGNKVNFVSFTPGTSLELKSSLGLRTERVLLLKLIEKAWGLQDRGFDHLMSGHVRRIERFRDAIRWFDEEHEIDADLATKFIADLEAQVASDRAAGRPDLRSRLEALVRGFSGGKRSVDDSTWGEGVAWIGEMRELLADTCISALEPDIVVLDEFQRFKGLLDGTDPASSLAKKLFDYPNVRVILLSATPYKMYTVRDEAQGEDHYRDFIETLRFLFNDPARTTEVEGLVAEYRRALFDVVGGSTARLERARDGLEAMLRSVMVRTERLAATDDRSGMLTQVPPRGVDLRASDVRSYVTLQRVARAVGQPDVVEYWKSSPYVLNFMDDYQLRKAFERGAKAADVAPVLSKNLAADSAALLDWKDIERYGRVDPANARLRALAGDTVGRGAWRLIWLPPSLPYTAPGAPFDDPQLLGLTKRLVFSAWRVVPKVVAALLSYEAERQMILSTDKAPENTPEARKRRAPLLRFQVSDGRLTGMPVLGMVYPARVLAQVGDPLPLRATRGAPVAVADALLEIRGRIVPLLQRLTRFATPGKGIDEAWYWAAPILLDLEDTEVGATTRAWWSRDDLAARWAGQVEVFEEDGAEAEGDDQETAWELHVAEAVKVVRSERVLGSPPDDLPDMLARLALGGAGACALRAVLRGTTRCAPGGAEADDLERADAAGRMARALRDVFNLPETIALLRGLDDGDRYWVRTVEYAIAGNLQSVLDEYLHVVRDNLGVATGPVSKACEVVAEAFESAAGLRTSRVDVRVVRADAERGTVGFGDGTLRTRFACRLAEEKADVGAATTRQDQVRAAFNSPFWPFVLVTTSVGQEGLDFHPYCHAVVHWNLPSNPVDLEQREGRVHRFKGHAVRKNLAQHFAGRLPASLATDPWDALFDLGVTSRRAGASELEPFWILPGDARIERHVPALPLSRDASQLEALRRALAIYRMVFGQPRQEELAAYLASRLSPALLDEVRRTGQIRLAPTAGSGHA
ncbi:MAG: hypothetical protein IT460_04075 [Planctomycetes bacterium]|nr:hypothetical protein [Planctomycetota bacterium]